MEYSNFITNLSSLRKFEDTKVVIKTRKSKNGILYNCQKRKNTKGHYTENKRLSNTKINRGEFSKGKQCLLHFWYHLFVSLIPPLFIEVMYLCARSIDFASFFSIFIFDFGILPTVRYSFFAYYFIVS